MTVRHRRAEAVIYAKSKGYPYYRLAYHTAGKRIVRSFQTFAEARKEARSKVRELSKGTQSIALSAKEAADALAIRDALEAFRQSTGRRVSAIQAVTGFLDVAKLLPIDESPAGVVRAYPDPATDGRFSSGSIPIGGNCPLSRNLK